jgi:hypothetical protein
MPEIIANLHLHTTASDGVKTHAEVAAAAAQAGLEVLLYTDHNIAVESIEGWYHHPPTGRQVLRLMGQEINDIKLVPELNHLLCFFVTEDLQPLAAHPQGLIEAIRERGGLSFLAHPLERPGIGAARQTYPWVSWDISGFTGIELWNAMTDAKWQLRTKKRAVLGAYLPPLALTGPFPEVLAKWDELLAAGHRVVAIGNADAHGVSFKMGPLRRVIFPYQLLFEAVNTHLLLAQPLAPQVSQAKQQVHQALSQGHCFVSYDRMASSRGFSFTAASGPAQAMMGDALPLHNSATLMVASPQPAYLRLLRQGRLVAQTYGRDLVWQTTAPGVYRVEAYRRYWGWRRGWVFTNPIYITPA